MRKCFGGVTLIVIQGTVFPAAAASVALRPVCHLGEFHTFYFFSPPPPSASPPTPPPPYLFIYLSFFLIPLYLLGIVQGPLFHCMLSQPFPPSSSTSSSLPPSVAAAFLLQLRKGDPVMSHLTTGGGGGGVRGGSRGAGRGEKRRRGSPKLAFPSQSSRGVFRIAE